MVSPPVICWNHEDHMVFHKRFYMHVSALFRTFNKRKMNLSGKQCFQHLVCIAAASCDSNLRIRASKCGNEIRQKVLSNRLGGSQRKLSSLLPEDSCNRRSSFIRDHLHFLSIWQQSLPPSAQRDMASSTIEQRNTEFVFQRFDLLCHSRLRQ